VRQRGYGHSRLAELLLVPSDVFRPDDLDNRTDIGPAFARGPGDGYERAQAVSHRGKRLRQVPGPFVVAHLPGHGYAPGCPSTAPTRWCSKPWALTWAIWRRVTWPAG